MPFYTTEFTQAANNKNIRTILKADKYIKKDCGIQLGEGLDSKPNSAETALYVRQIARAKEGRKEKLFSVLRMEGVKISNNECAKNPEQLCESL